MKVNFISFGCKVNQYETECIKQAFSNNNYIITENKSDADIYIINSCTVTSSSDSKVLQCIKRLRNDNPLALIVLTGCYPQAFMDEAREIIEADVITGTKNRSELLSLVNEAIKKKNPNKIINLSDFDGNELLEDMTCSEFTNKTRAFVKIQDGCNQFCSYCIIPYARGRIRSKPIDALKKEVSTLAKNGHKEIVLVGINLAFYGNEFGLRLIDAVEASAKIKGIERIRLGSLEPEIISDDDLLRLANVPQFCPHFHLSLQSGCEKTLKEMNRKYTTAEYERLINKIRDTFPDSSITTDVMVGFPNENEEDFEQSLAFVEKIGFSRIHVFPYSKREGTIAAKHPNQIPDNIKSFRAKKMSYIAEKSMQKFLHSQVGKVYPVLFEKENCTKFHQGYSPNYTLIKIQSKICEKSLRRMIFYVKILKCKNNYCLGDIIEKH
ncbi:MAG: tRNA (N(6)-L-threonylcarbamoyladenosine(37)-C(2))-methylthiotransferase MtaB [Clostridiales bacterium]|nr:tRNA (N(6)-L-threonylcarbamoyladenosine(37)-C(2))-methylthiotransferase MtaB [Clostridiales bacterium]